MRSWIWDSVSSAMAAFGGQTPLSNAPICDPSIFTFPHMEGLEILSVNAIPLFNHTFVPGALAGAAQINPVGNLSFCNVTVTYTHTGWGDTINIINYLPLTEHWNGRFLANGGGGYITGGEEMVYYSMVYGLAEGFAVSTTDGGHSANLAENFGYSSDWALSSPGNVNWPLLMDFSHVALHDMAVVGKKVVETFYQSPPKYSYFYGGSTGGRQGHMLAQRYPKDFQGIIAQLPAINWTKFIWALLYPIFTMDKLKTYPRPCEIQAMREAGIEACDDLDGLKDGIISMPGLCHFDPHVLVARSFECDGSKATFTSDTAKIVSSAWNGPRSETGDFQWYGFGVDAQISRGEYGPAATTCESKGACTTSPFSLASVWARYWVAKNPDLDLSALTHEEWDDLFHTSVNEYESIIGTSDPDLRRFKKAGGKMLNWHGMADQVIPFNGSTNYYDRVLKIDPQANEFYRLFLAPGVDHSGWGQIAPKATDLMNIIMDWVEKGIAPEVLPASGSTPAGIFSERNLCMYPQVQHYVKGDGTTRDSFKCV